jgi:DNA-binding beta-propeller fold protein YncE
MLNAVHSKRRGLLVWFVLGTVVALWSGFWLRGPQLATAAPALGPGAACSHAPEGGGPADGVRIMDTGNNRVQWMNGNDGTFGTPFGTAGSGNSQFNSASGIAFVPWDTTYVADTNNNRVQLFDRGGGFVMAFGTAGSGNSQFNAPRGIAVNSMGNIYVLDSGNNRVQVFASDGTYQRQWGTSGSSNSQFNAPAGIAINWGDGSVYVADTGNHRIQKFDGTGTFVTVWGSVGSGASQFSSPAALAVNPLNGDVYVADTGNNRVQQFGSGGAFIRQWGGFNGPKGITVGARNGVFVMDTINNQVKRFGYDGTPQGIFGGSGSGTGQFSGATQIAADLGGANLDQCYVTDFFIAAGQKRRITVFYTLNNGLPANRFRNTNDGSGNNIYAKKVADWTQTAWQTFYNDSFSEPVYLYTGVDLGGGFTGKEQEVQAFDIGRVGADGWCCGWNHYQINSAYVVGQIDSGEDRGVGEVAIHEMFHNVQSGAFSNFEPGWASEGGAGNIQDKVTTSIDTNAGSRYMGLVNDYFINRSAGDFRNLAYPFAPFWTYFEEQLGGATPADPGYGVSAVRQYVETTRGGGVHGIDALNNSVLALSGNTRNFENFWTDFTVANYTKRISGAGPRYSYLDEVSTPYPAVPVNRQTLSSTPITFTQAISAYAASYVEIVPSGVSCKYVTFDLRSDVRVGFTLADHRAGAMVRAPETFYGTRRIITLHVGGSYGGSDAMGVILTGLTNQANVTLGTRCVNPVLSIIRPNTIQKAMAGPAATDNPGAFVAYASITADGGPVRGLLYSQFTSQVGGITATLTTGSDLEDLFALVIAAPRQETIGDYDLGVTLDSAISATQTLSVRYSSATDENMLVVDVSGSMSDFGKMQAAKDAAQLQITEMDQNARGGMATFSTTATIRLSLTNITVDPPRTNLRNAVNALSPGGATAIVAGLNTALDNLDARGDIANSCGITLLTDGMDNQSTPTDRSNLITRLSTYARPCPVYAIALGPDADKTFIQQFADASGGIVYAATLTTPTGLLGPSNSVRLAPANGGVLTASWQNRLVGIYDDIEARQAGRRRIFVGASMTGGTPPTENIAVDPSVTEAVFALNGTNGYNKGVGLYDPNGTLVDAGYPNAKIYDITPLHWVIRIGAPKPGTWQIRFTGQVPTGGYIAMTSGVTPIALDVFARPPDFIPATGHRVSIIGVLHNATTTIPGATVLADVQSAQGDIWHLQLFDDGNHGDGRAGDGVYGNWFTRATTAPCHQDAEGILKQPLCDNAYQVYVVATKGDIRRDGQTGFSIKQGQDSDQDGMTDEWEIAHGLNAIDPSDALLDPDGDHLSNLDEYRAGTDPFNPDTDGGGENDSSEVAHGRDPLNGGDDHIAPIFHIDPHAFSSYVVLNFSTSQLFTHFQIFRRIAPFTGVSAPAASGWLTVTTQAPPTGVYTDTQVSNGSTYQYRVIGVTADGSESTVLESTPTTPNTLTEPPNGLVRINDGAGRTISRHVKLTFEWQSSATQMRFGNSPNLSNRPWQPVMSLVEADLDPNVPVGGAAFVYVEFRDPYGNLSDHVDPASILIAQPLYLPIIRR